MNHVADGIRHATRALRRAPTFAIAVMLSLALGIGANTTMFTFLDAVLLRPLPYPHPDELVAPSLGTSGTVSDLYFLAWAASTHTLSAIAEYNNTLMVVGGSTAPEEIPGAIASPSLTQVLGVAPVLGRFITAADGLPGATPVVVLSHDTWQRLFGSDPHILGRAISINDQQTTVVGVMPPGFAFPPHTEMWQARPPIDLRPGAGLRGGLAVGRRRPNVSTEQVRRELERVPRTPELQRSLLYRDAPVVVALLHDELYGSARPAVVLLFAAVTLLFLIACANIANLVLARTTRRRQAFAVRSALGASRAVIYWEVVTECLLLALAGGVLGVLLSVWMSQLFARLSPDSFSNVGKIGVDGRVLLFSVGVSVLAAFLVSSWPALKIAGAGAHSLLSEGGSRTGGGVFTHLMRRTLVVVQLSAALLLLTGAGLLVKSLTRLTTQDNGFQPRHLLIVTAHLAGARYRGTSAVAHAHEFFDELTARLGAMPGVLRVAQGPSPLMGYQHLYLRAATPESPSFRIAVTDVGPEYFETYEVPLLAGRSITARDDSTQPPVVVVNATAARLIAPGRSAIGQSFDVVTIGGQHPIIVGIVADVPQRDVAVRPLPEAFTATKQDPHWPASVAVRVVGDPDALALSAQRAVRALDPEVVANAVSMESMMATSVAPHRFTAVLLGAFALLATTLAAIGLFGVIAYLVEQRTREIGVRVALGAQKWHVLTLILREGVMLTAVGLVAGIVLSLAFARLLKSQLYEVVPTDTTVIVVAALALAAVAIVAALIPARRATLVDPLISLRAE